MNARQALALARAHGIRIQRDGEQLSLEAAEAPPSTEILELLVRHKQGIVALLRPGRDGWSADDWQVFFDERAGIAEFDGGLPRPEAEARAFACCLAEWQNRNFVPSSSGLCLACGCSDRAHDPLLPYGMESTGHAWLHSRCWPAWQAGRRATATAALADMGILAFARTPFEKISAKRDQSAKPVQNGAIGHRERR
jgi:hypothetical protein